ncbi:unnamed protein product [Urochloa humidicola]
MESSSGQELDLVSKEIHTARRAWIQSRKYSKKYKLNKRNHAGEEEGASSHRIRPMCSISLSGCRHRFGDNDLKPVMEKIDLATEEVPGAWSLSDTEDRKFNVCLASLPRDTVGSTQSCAAACALRRDRRDSCLTMPPPCSSAGNSVTLHGTSVAANLGVRHRCNQLRRGGRLGSGGSGARGHVRRRHASMVASTATGKHMRNQE